MCHYSFGMAPTVQQQHPAKEIKNVKDNNLTNDITYSGRLKSRLQTEVKVQFWDTATDGQHLVTRLSLSMAGLDQTNLQEHTPKYAWMVRGLKSLL